MFSIPNERVTEVDINETFWVSRVGNGVAILAGKKVVLEVPSEGRRLGERFTATRNNILVPDHLIKMGKDLTSKTGFLSKKLFKRTKSGRYVRSLTPL